MSRGLPKSKSSGPDRLSNEYYKHFKQHPCYEDNEKLHITISDAKIFNKVSANPTKNEENDLPTANGIHSRDGSLDVI